MDRFIARENVKRYKQQLESCTDEAQRMTLQALLAEEAGNLRAMNLKIRS